MRGDTVSFISIDISPVRYDLFLGALLHDIGKFYIRTNDSVLRSHIRNKYGSAAHQFWGDYFLTTQAENIGGTVLNIVKNHHDCSKNDISEMIVAIADKLSASDREEHESQSDKEIDKNVMQLISVFCDINNDNHEFKFEETWYKKPVTRDVLHFADKEIHDNINEEYAELFKSFKESFNRIYSEYAEDKFLFSTYLYHLIENYTFNIPSAYYYNRPSISLWAHLKTTAAIAIALYNQLKAEFPDENEQESKIKRRLETILNKLSSPSAFAENESPCFALIKGDISGIQDFVYDTDMDGASNALKGKSFYVSFLMDTIAKFIAAKESLTTANILMCGGGHFYILAPGITMSRINEYQEYIDKVMFSAHGNKLSVLLACVPVNICDFILQDKKENATNNISIKFREVSSAVQARKTQKYRELISKKGMVFFEPEEDFTNKCPRCSRETVLAGDKYICPFCDSFIRLGKELAKKDYLCSSFDGLSEINISDEPGKINGIKSVTDVFACFGRNIAFVDESDLKKRNTHKIFYALKKKEDNTCYPTLNISTSVPVEENEYGDKAIKEIERIAKASKGVDTWAILRGDVDNLGNIFTKGLGKNAPFSKLITLSEEFSVFFSLYLDQLIIENEKWRDNIIVLSAGGDDFCLIGPWSEIPKVAYRIRQVFAKYTHGNPALSISMGLEIAPDIKYPVYKVALTSGENLDKAKSHVHSDGSVKNSLAFSKHIVKWDEYDSLEKIKDKIVDLLENKNVSKALLNIIYSTTAQKEISAKQNEIFKSWRFLYAMKRLAKRSKNEVDDKLKDIEDAMIDKKDNSLYKLAYLAARWCELEIRE